MSIPLIFITGFLGSGKTTLISSLIALRGSRRIGVLVNEWGTVSVDGALLVPPEGREGEEGTAVRVVEVNGGQIFCSCVSGSFVEGVATLADRNPDFILVETSGLARPGPMDTVVRAAILASGGRTHYGATVCVADAVRFGKLAHTSVAAREQAARSDVLVLAKTDRASPHEISSALQMLGQLRPGLEVHPVIHGDVPQAFLEELLAVRAESAPRAGAGIIAPGWGSAGRPASFLLDFENPGSGNSAVRPSLVELRAFLESIAPLALRSKGILELAGRAEGSAGTGSGVGAESDSSRSGHAAEGVSPYLVLAETAGELVSVTPSGGKPTAFVVIALRSGESEIRRLWSQYFSGGKPVRH